MESKNALGGFIQFTQVGTTQVQLVPVNRVRSVYETVDQTKTFIKFIGAKDAIEIVEDIPTIFAQQNTTGKDLNMVLVTRTDTKDSHRVIYFAHHMKQVVTEGEGARIVFDDNHRDVVVEETLATIYGYQSAAVNLGMVFLTRASDGIEFIEFTSFIKSVLPFPSDLDTAPTGSLISFHPTRDQIIVSETPATIFAASV